MNTISLYLKVSLFLFSEAVVQGFIHAPLKAVRTVDRDLVAKDGISIPVENEEILYSMQLKIGEPPQKVVVQIDTGSAELWVSPVCSTAGSQSQRQHCQSNGHYDPSKSDSSTGLTTEYGSVTYGDGSNATFAYFKDNVTLGGVSFEQTFGVATESYDIYAGLIGLGPDLDYGFAKGKPYSLVLNSMAQQGLINSRVFSLDLHGYDDPEGSIIFGGIDIKKFKGALSKTGIIVSSEGKARLTITMTGAGVVFPNGSNSKYDTVRRNVLLDSGATISLLAEDLATHIFNSLEAQKTQTGVFVANCSLREQPGSITFGFEGKSIEVPYDTFIRDANPTSDSSLCSVGLRVAPVGTQQILGDSFLRAAYVVFDWDNEEVHLAQAADCGSEIVAIGSGSDAVPSATGLCGTTTTAFTGDAIGTSTASSGRSSQTVSLSTPTASQSSDERSGATETRLKPCLRTVGLACTAIAALSGLR